jgi:hypothetical protein
MYRTSKLALKALLPAVVLTGCHDWLTGGELTQNPNSPTAATPSTLIVSAQVAQTLIQTGDLARNFAMWMQQMAGTDRQYITQGVYIYSEDTFSQDWSLFYTGGGLYDIRSLQTQSLATGDSVFAGIGLVLEALDIGTAADIWGDIPYSQAVNPAIATPVLDPQQTVYATIQAKLDTAILYLACTGLTCVGPGTTDLWYGGDPALWTELAHTLKARYYLHVAERDPTAYASAIPQAQAGISDTTHDLRSYQSSDPNEENVWYQFIVEQRTGYISAGEFLVNLLASTSDPRLARYFAPNSAGQIVGAPPGGGTQEFSTLSDLRLTPDFRQPMVTYAENQLILAEAALQTGDQATANAAYNAERASQGVPAAAGNVTLADIITEKYIALFQQIEPWNDYKRTCLPAITPAQSTGVPGRLLYPLSAERNANPNVPPPQAQPPRNWNDPNPCPAPAPAVASRLARLH